MRRVPFALTTSACLRIVAAVVLAASLGGQAQSASQQAHRQNVILISVDTLRGDRLHCISPSAEATPNIDKLLQGGTLFSQATSLVPLTLPSHVAMLTSTYPFLNGVEDNAQRLPAGAVTLAGTLRNNGYQTAAFLGSFVLDPRFGLEQGFATYDSPAVSSQGGSTDPGDVKRKGEDVAKAGEAWLDEHAERPFFLFLHFYDLHTPYNLSAEEEARYGKGYNGELRYIDHVIGDLWQYLMAHHLVDSSLIVFTSDHGEGLGDHGETTHGFFVYQSTLHVPLIMHWPASDAKRPPQVDTPATLLDLSPTVLTELKLGVPPEMQGISMLSANGPLREVVSESVYPQRHFGTSALVALRRGHYKYIEAPRPEFYDLAQDPGEHNNLYASKAALASAFRERLRLLQASRKPGALPAAALSPEAVERLHALGYLTGSSATAPTGSPGRVDPKDRIGDFEAYGRAIALASLGQVEDSNAALASILARNPDLMDVRLTLGLNQQRMGKDEEALQQFRAVLVAEPANAVAHLDAGLSYYHLRQYDLAEKELGATLAISPGYTKAEISLAKTLAEKGELAQADAEFHLVLAQTPQNYEAHDGLGTLLAMRGEWDGSVRELQAALRIEPDAAETHNTLGNVYLQQGELDKARGQFAEALREQPNYAAAHYNLGRMLIAAGDTKGASSEFTQALQSDPNYLPARDALSRLGASQH